MCLYCRPEADEKAPQSGDISYFRVVRKRPVYRVVMTTLSLARAEGCLKRYIPFYNKLQNAFQHIVSDYISLLVAVNIEGRSLSSSFSRLQSLMTNFLNNRCAERFRVVSRTYLWLILRAVFASFWPNMNYVKKFVRNSLFSMLFEVLKWWDSHFWNILNTFTK